MDSNDHKRAEEIAELLNVPGLAGQLWELFRDYNADGGMPTQEEVEQVIYKAERSKIDAITTFASEVRREQKRAYQRRLYDECVTAGWDSAKQNSFAEEIAHLHEELSEAFREFRRHKDFDIRVVNGKPEGIPIEFADVLIGLFYNAELHGFDLFAAVEQKHQFNLKRNYESEGRQLHPAIRNEVEP